VQAQDGDEGVAELLGRMDDLWQRRDQRGALIDQVALGDLALAIEPDNYDATWRVARAYFWVAHLQSSRVWKKAMAGKAAELAQRAMRQQPQRVEGHYVYAVAIAEYAASVGIVQAIVEGMGTKVEQAALASYARDPAFEQGGIIVLLGRYYFVLPWPKRDLERSRRYLEEARARFPQQLVTRCFLAETYHDLDEDDAARAELEFILANPPPPGAPRQEPDPTACARAHMQRWSRR
ncbi:MAG: hypothetical protein ACRERC_16405, partial [Candidatus Binatia bacterium]